MIGIVLYEVYISGLSRFIAGGVFILGLIIGFLIARMFHIFWDEKSQLVTSRIDTIGGIILGVYIIFSIFRHYLIASIFQQSLVTVVTFAFAGGIMIGRFFGMRNQILKTLKGKNIGKE